MRRRLFLSSGLSSLLMLAGCSSKSKKGRGRDSRDPTRFGTMLMDSYIADLKKGPAAKQVSAANELANMGSKATSALPHLEKLAKGSDAKVRDAAKSAIAAIKKKK